MDRTPLHRSDGVVHVAGLVERVGVDGNGAVIVIGEAQRIVDHSGRRAPILVQFETDRTRLKHVHQSTVSGGVALAAESKVQREIVGCLQHHLDLAR